MDATMFAEMTRRNPEPNRRYLILDGPRAGWVMPGNMLLRNEELFTSDSLSESVVPINPTVTVGDRVVPLKMRNSEVTEGVVRTVREKTVMVEGRYDQFEEWVRLPQNMPDNDRHLLLLQIREHLLLEGYEKESRRRGWNKFWLDVNQSAGFTPRPVPTYMRVRTKWRISRYELGNFMVPEKYREIVEASDDFIMSHVTTDHTIMLANVAAECRCADHARVHRLGQEVTSGESFRLISDYLSRGMKSRMEMASVEVRELSCAYGLTSL
jgi:hypothetical protein